MKALTDSPVRNVAAGHDSRTGDDATMHHSEHREYQEQMAKELGLGATGQHPDGKLHESDEGEIKMGVTVDQGKVVLAFGKPVAWVGMDAKQARQLAELLQTRSYEAAIGEAEAKRKHN